MEGRIDQSFSLRYFVDSKFYTDNECRYFDYSYLLNIIIETSAGHDQSLNRQIGEPFLPANVTWIITQNTGWIQKLPQVGEDLVIETRVSKANRFFATRWFGIWQSSQLIMEFQIQFAALNLTTRQIAKVPHQKLVAKNLVDNRLYIRNKDKLKVIEPTRSRENSLQIKPEDIDDNCHVNNLVYIRWALQALEDFISSDYELKIISIKYGHELLNDHQVELRTSIEAPKEERSENLISVQTFFNQTAQEEACRVITKWQKIMIEKAGKE